MVILIQQNNEQKVMEALFAIYNIIAFNYLDENCSEREGKGMKIIDRKRENMSKIEKYDKFYISIIFLFSPLKIAAMNKMCLKCVIKTRT